MAPKRLSKAEKQSILDLYRQPAETTSTLAARFGVSSSTVSRVLKQGLSADEYEALVQQKRTGVPRPFPAAAPNPLVESSSEGVAASRRILAAVDGAELDPGEAAASVGQRAAEEAPLAGGEVDPSLPEPGGLEPEGADPSADQDLAAEQDLVAEVAASVSPSLSNGRPGPILRKRSKLDDSADSDDDDAHSAAELDAELDSDEELDEFQDDLDSDDDDDFGDLDDDEDDGESDEDFGFQVADGAYLDVRPISEANLPRTCYLVIDRAAELITRPLSDFADLGHIPSGETEEKTLPVFDNHRVAKRFSNRRVHRIVKVPDGRLLQKTTAYLQAKGITRLLFDGQVYALSNEDN
ncbi:MAG: helix-turn-helix domain-containing protein [Elainellaceae cyanobacterium]